MDCFTLNLDKNFLVFFFKRLGINTGKYVDDFPFVSRCGPEINYVYCENRPIVFTDLIDNEKTGTEIVVNGIGPKMALPFQPERLCMLPKNGRVYHPAPKKAGGVGILKTSLAIEFSSHFIFEETDPERDPPTHFMWKDKKYKLDNLLWNILKDENVEGGDGD